MYTHINTYKYTVSKRLEQESRSQQWCAAYSVSTRHERQISSVLQNSFLNRFGLWYRHGPPLLILGFFVPRCGWVGVGRCVCHTAMHHNTLQHIATDCNTLQHTATHCNTLQHTATQKGSYLLILGFVAPRCVCVRERESECECVHMWVYSCLRVYVFECVFCVYACVRVRVLCLRVYMRV